MSKIEIKAAMSALQVNVPIRLAQRAPVFQPPERAPVSENFEVPQDSEGSPEPQLSQDSRPSSDSPPSPKHQGSSELEGSQDSRLPHDSKPTLVSRPKGVSKRQVLILSEDGQELRLNKKEMVAKDLVNHLNLSVDGYGAMTNRMLEILIHADFDKAEHEIIQFVMRESIFWRQEWTDPMSGVEFEWMSGISSSSLWTHMKRLAQKGWIDRELAKSKDNTKAQYRNRYRLNPEVWGPLFPRKRKGGQESKGSPETEPSQESQVEDGQDSRPPTTSENQTTSSLYKNSDLKTDLKTSLSQAPELLETRWQKMADKGKREREIFLNLIETYGRPVWDHCGEVIEDLKQYGDFRKRPVGSPFGLLGVGDNWELFLGRTLARKAKAAAVNAARHPELSSSHQKSHSSEQEEPQAPPPPGFFEALGHRRRRGPDQSMKVFQGGSADMEAAFTQYFVSREAQWAEIHRQLGSRAKDIGDPKGQWFAGIQLWFRGAWDRGEVA